MTERLLPFDEDPEDPTVRLDRIDEAGRARAVDPRFNVALEASAGTGKTRVLVERYVNLLKAGVEPSEILALTFTRKAATEMRERIVATLREAAGRGEIPAARWRDLRDRTAEVAISTIDAFCLSLLREFPLEADLDPGFAVADDTEVPRLMDEALDRALRTCRAVAREDEHVALVFAQLGDRRAREGLASLLDRRIVAPGILSRYVRALPAGTGLAETAARGAGRLLDVFGAMRGGLPRFLDSGPLHPTFALLSRALGSLDESADPPPVLVQSAYAGARAHFLTQDGKPRVRLRQEYRKELFASEADRLTHRKLVTEHAEAVLEADRFYRRELNGLVARGVLRMFRIAEAEYRRTLDARAVLDFPDLLQKALDLLGQMEEFAQSRFRLESRYHHVLVDEFQDTSRAQWDLVRLLVAAWGEGAGLAQSGALPPTIFIVGDRKQSIYAFRDADVSLLREASRQLSLLRPDGDVRRSISRSHRSVPALLAFVNAVCDQVPKQVGRQDAFEYEERDRFPVDPLPPGAGAGAGELGLVVGDSPEACAEAVATEIERLLREETLVRDRDTGVRRPVQRGDIAILFRTRESHREYEHALERRAIPSYVYKGLGFYEADEIQDVMALLWHLADPESDLRAAAWLRSRLIGVSDEALRRIGPGLASALLRGTPDVQLDASDRDLFEAARAGSKRWRRLVDRLPPAELLDCVLEESAYGVELRGPRRVQARENLKKVRAMIRRIQNRGYATVERVAAHLDRLALGDEANAVIDAADAVSLMTVHASKGLEFPVVFVVNLARGTGGRRDPIRVTVDDLSQEVSVAIGDFESPSDEDLDRKEREESKRLLYVALTRARDRLYLGSVVNDARVDVRRGSLAEVMPDSLQKVIAAAASGQSEVAWETPDGGRHVFRVCVAEPAGPATPALERVAGAPRDFGRLEDSLPGRMTVGSQADTVAGGISPVGGEASDRLIGTLVHRLVERMGLAPVEESALRRTAGLILAELPGSPDVDTAGVIRRALAAFASLAGRDDLAALYRRSQAFHEVPFSFVSGGAVVRGTIDCLLRESPGRLTVLEFKTGRRRPEHDAQVEAYRRAVEAFEPGVTVDVRLVYADGQS